MLWISIPRRYICAVAYSIGILWAESEVSHNGIPQSGIVRVESCQMFYFFKKSHSSSNHVLSKLCFTSFKNMAFPHDYVLFALVLNDSDVDCNSPMGSVCVTFCSSNASFPSVFARPTQACSTWAYYFSSDRLGSIFPLCLPLSANIPLAGL